MKLNTLGPDVLLHARNQLNMAVPSENASALQLRSLEATIALLKSKRPRALAEEQKQDILVAYHSLQAEDAKELLENPEQKPKGHYQQRVAALLGYSTKTVGLVYRDWHHQQEIQVAMPPANRRPKQQRIPKSNDVLLAVRTLVREKRSRNERVVARHVLDLMRQRMWIVVDEQDPKAYASSLRCVRRYLSQHGYRRGDSTALQVREKESVVVARIRYLQRLVDNDSAPVSEQLRIVDLDESYIHHHYRRDHDSLFDPHDTQSVCERTQKKGKRFCFIAAIQNSSPSKRIKNSSDNAGLVPNSVWIFQSQKSSGDYHQNFNGANFVHWFKTQLLPNLTEPCLIRLDNARYHCTKPESVPKVGKAKKAEIQHVLTTLGISFNAKDTLSTLRQKLKAYVASVDAEIVQLAKEQGHEVLYTPPYHCDLQPIEMVWSQVKGEVGRQYDVSTTMQLVHQRLAKAFEKLGSDTTGRVERLYEHVHQIELEYMRMDEDDSDEASEESEDDSDEASEV